MYKTFPLYTIIFRRILVVLAGVLAFPIMACLQSRSQFYSYLHRSWHKTSTKPVWLKQTEKGSKELF